MCEVFCKVVHTRVVRVDFKNLFTIFWFYNIKKSFTFHNWFMKIFRSTKIFELFCLFLTNSFWTKKLLYGIIIKFLVPQRKFKNFNRICRSTKKINNFQKPCSTKKWLYKQTSNKNFSFHKTYFNEILMKFWFHKKCFSEFRCYFSFHNINVMIFDFFNIPQNILESFTHKNLLQKIFKEILVLRHFFVPKFKFERT